MKEGLDIVNKNIKYIRKLSNQTQEAFATELGIKRSSLGAYEEGRARPNQNTINEIAKKYNLTLDQLLTEDLSEAATASLFNSKGDKSSKYSGNKMRVLAVTVDSDDRENIEMVQVKARAGYLEGYADPEYLSDLPRFRLPFLPQGTYRAFEIQGDSMLPLQPGSIVVGEYVEDWYNIKNGDTYVIISKDDGVVYKRVTNNINRDGTFSLLSDNLAYPVYELNADSVMEVWKAKAFISQDLPESNMSIAKVSSIVMDLQQQVGSLRDELDSNRSKSSTKTGKAKKK